MIYNTITARDFFAQIVGNTGLFINIYTKAIKKRMLYFCKFCVLFSIKSILNIEGWILRQIIKAKK